MTKALHRRKKSDCKSPGKSPSVSRSLASAGKSARRRPTVLRMSPALELVGELAGSRSALAACSPAFPGVFVLLSLAVMGVLTN
jgi:hypothetical protein